MKKTLILTTDEKIKVLSSLLGGSSESNAIQKANISKARLDLTRKEDNDFDFCLTTIAYARYTTRDYADRQVQRDLDRRNAEKRRKKK